MRIIYLEIKNNDQLIYFKNIWKNSICGKSYSII